MSEDEARRIFDHKFSVCSVLGGDVKAECIRAGVPAEMVDRFLRGQQKFTRFMSSHDDLGNRKTSQGR